MNKSRGIWKQAILLMKVAQFVNLVPRPSTQLMLLAILAGTRLTESLYLLWRRWSILEQGKCTVPVGSSSSCRGRWGLPPYCRMEGTHRACGSVCVWGGGERVGNTKAHVSQDVFQQEHTMTSLYSTWKSTSSCTLGFTKQGTWYVYSHSSQVVGLIHIMGCM